MLAASAQPSDAIAVLLPGYEEVTEGYVARIADKVGGEPAYLAVVAAASEPIASPEFNLPGIATTTGSATMCIIVNGPAARELGINCGVNALGPGNRANATIGRAVRLTLQNAGGARSGET